MGGGLVPPDAIFGTAGAGRSYILAVWFDNSDPHRTLKKIDLDRLVMRIYNREA